MLRRLSGTGVNNSGLEYFFDLKNKKFLSNLHRNEFAYWNRAEKQFHRIKYNRCLQFYVKKYNIDYNLTDFKNFLNRTNSIPEYPTIINYIYSYLKDKGVTVWDIFFKLEYYNKKDACLDRKQKIGAKLAEFKKKYLSKNIDYDGNKLMQILAVVGVDDENYINYEPFGSLTVDNYGQIGIFDLVDCGLNIFAHPNHKKLFLINELRDVIDGLEINYRSLQHENDMVNKSILNNNILKTIGSDSHNLLDKYYNNQEFYNLTYEELLNFYLCAKDKMLI